ncbi:carboxypeptidase regulatory-like domain-containing protein [Bdellovibrionota bacterium]
MSLFLLTAVDDCRVDDALRGNSETVHMYMVEQAAEQPACAPISSASATIGGHSFPADNTGRVSANLIPGTYSVQASAPGYTTVNQDVYLAPESTPVFALEPDGSVLGGTVSGTVSDVSSNPLEFVDVSEVCSLAVPSTAILKAVTAADGYYSISNLVQGDHTFIYEAPLYITASRQINLGAPDITLDVTLILAID